MVDTCQPGGSASSQLWFTDVQGISVRVVKGWHDSHSQFRTPAKLSHSLSMHKRLDIESESRADAHYIFAVEFLQNRRLPGVVKAAGFQPLLFRAIMPSGHAYRNKMRISFSFCLFFRMIVSRPIFARVWGGSNVQVESQRRYAARMASCPCTEPIYRRLTHCHIHISHRHIEQWLTRWHFY